MTIANRLTRFSLRTALVLMALVAVAFGILGVPGRRAQHLANVLAAGDRDEIVRLLGYEERTALPFPLCPMKEDGELSEQEMNEYSKIIKAQVAPPTAWQYLTCHRTVTVKGSAKAAIWMFHLVHPRY